MSVSGKDILICGLRIDNQTILLASAISFGLFVAAEIIGALASGSLSLLGDAGAMSVDVFTYFCNLYSEYAKKKYGKLDTTTRFVLEVGIPSFSLIALLAVTGWITYDAITIILHPENDKVNVAFLFGFAGGNALVDVLCAVLFYLRRRDVLKDPLQHLKVSISQEPHVHGDVDPTISPLNEMENGTAYANAIAIALVKGNEGEEGKEKSNCNCKSNGHCNHDADNDDNTNNTKNNNTNISNNVNLNMASALTHVSGDTLRTSTVFIAAIVATTTKLSGAICDAWAAVIVTITIIFIVIPLAYEIYQHAKKFL